jgi:hypothetical protein
MKYNPSTHSEKRDSLLKSNSQGRSQVLKWLKRVLLGDYHQLVTESLIEAVENEIEHFAHHLCFEVRNTLKAQRL